MKYKGFNHLLLHFLYFASFMPSVNDIPGTNHVFIKREGSSDLSCQRKYINTIIEKLNDDHNDATVLASKFKSDANTKTLSSPSISSVRGLPQEPYCFVIDKDCVPYVIDTGANRIIVNDTRYLRNL